MSEKWDGQYRHIGIAHIVATYRMGRKPTHPTLLEDGSFDHIMWVTMTDEGPKVVNLMLDGIFDDDPTK